MAYCIEEHASALGFTFTENKHQVTLASPKGGVAPIDPKSMDLVEAIGE